MANAKITEHQQRVEQAHRAHEAALGEVWAVARSVKRDPTLTTDERDALLRELYKPLSTKDIKAFVADDIHEHRVGVSFRASISHLRHVKQSLSTKGYALSLGGNPKMADRDFAQALGIPTPRTLVRDQLPQNLPIEPGIVLKPLRGAGAAGVFYVDADLNIRSVKSGLVYRNMKEAVTELKGRPVANEAIWLAEEIIVNDAGEPAHDLKVYMFYGEPAIVIEIGRRQGDGGSDAYCCYAPDGRIIDIGLREVSQFIGAGIPKDLLSKARLLSVQSPVPFLRLDFHRGAESSYLGEITPHPGSTYAGDIYDTVDKELGEAFIDAEARLMIDLLNGKTFDAYFAAYGEPQVPSE